MGIGSENDGCGVGQTEMTGNALSHRRHHLAEYRLPFSIGKPRRIVPARLLRIKSDIWPEMVAVCG